MVFIYDCSVILANTRPNAYQYSKTEFKLLHPYRSNCKNSKLIVLFLGSCFHNPNFLERKKRSYFKIPEPTSSDDLITP